MSDPAIWSATLNKLILAITLLCLCATAIAQPDFEETKTLAEQGLATAQYNLGVMYYFGLGVPQNDTEAARKVSAEVFANAVAIFGYEGVADITGLVGYYSFIAITLKAFDVQRTVGSELLLPVLNN